MRLWRYLRRPRIKDSPKCALLAILVFGTIYLLVHLQTEDVHVHKQSRVIDVHALIENTIKGGVSLKSEALRRRQSAIRHGDFVANCGLDTSCKEDAFPIHVYTGQNHNDTPKLCVNNHYIFDKNLNKAGRGLNIALIDSLDFNVLLARNFDTYETDATQLELFLEKYPQPGDIIAVFTFDEAASKLSDLAKKMFYELGSGCIQNMKFRASWYMISQKGIKGFTPYEKMSLTYDKKEWGTVLDDRFCVPRKIEGQSVHPDMPTSENTQRREFCKMYNGYGEFCSDESVDDPLTPAHLLNISMKNHPIFHVPIIVMAGTSLYSLPMTLETIIRQPGIKPEMVAVYLLEAHYAEGASLTSLFNFTVHKFQNAESYADMVDAAFNKTVQMYPDADHIIFIEDDLVLSPDYLTYMSQVMSLLEKDPTLYSISAWNDNGYTGTSSDSSAVYRVEGFPGLAFMISKTTYIRQMRGNMNKCCTKRAWHKWQLSTSEVVEMVVPDVSRTVHLPYIGLGPDIVMLENLFNRERFANTNSSIAISKPLDLISLNYEFNLKSLIESAVVLEMSGEKLKTCDNEFNKNQLFKNLGNQRSVYTLYYSQSNSSDYTILQQLCRCFGLFYAESELPRGLHRGMLRFSIKKNILLFIGSKSPYYKFAPQEHVPVAVANIMDCYLRPLCKHRL